jgi:Ca2+-binding EF-hand superfamily protein
MYSRRIGLLVMALAVPAGANAQQRADTTNRFASMDRNRDGVVTRTEWQGSRRSFDLHDWNADGVLSGDELRQDRRRPGRTDEETFENAPRQDDFTDWTAEGFRELDRNRDGRLTLEEWHFNREGFRRADHNGDNIVSRAEFLGETGDQRRDRFGALDTDNDGRVSRAEWPGTAERFALLDANRDGRLSRDEFAGSPAETRTVAYRAGYDRGLTEGRAAGREDRERNQGWDLEGQRELESADSGYDARFGPRDEYQAGYREAFRRGYREGWNQR